ncbi:MAG: RdgB/HAM1 family non-canonical purine NTP pyrophosphatase [Clostridiales bacterium]|nr:RdgB/HAM1 family non-canonical purine NTP pyrophosphatase [Clostridiales bacterium]
MIKVVIASNNPGKIKEIKDIWGDNKFKFLSQKEFGFIENIEEDQDSFMGNALKKALSVVRAVNKPTIADDSGLVVDALDGEPGIFSARYAGINATDGKNNEKVLRLLKDVPPGLRGAQFCCAMVLVLPDGKTFSAEGRCKGMIAEQPIGNNGFGYDPIFIPNGYDETFGQLPNHIKRGISHRADAIKNLKENLMASTHYFGNLLRD